MNARLVWNDEVVWPLIAIASFLHFMLTVNLVFVPFPTLGVFAVVVERLVKTDLAVFLVFLLLTEALEVYRA